jgi:pantothenate kinase
MSFTSTLTMDLPKSPIVQVRTTDKRGFTTEELANQCADKLISISDTAEPALREQARAFKKQAIFLIQSYLDTAVQSDRTTVYNMLNQAGQPEMVEILKRV